jgi:hypothetical protein
MKTNLIICSALVGAFLFACDKKEKDSYTDAMHEEVVSDGTRQDERAAMQSPEPLGQHELVDTLQLPQPLLIILKKDPATSPERIKSVREYTEDAIQYYEVVFNEPVKGEDTITYDNLGRVKSPELQRKDNQ